MTARAHGEICKRVKEHGHDLNKIPIEPFQKRVRILITSNLYLPEKSKQNKGEEEGELLSEILGEEMTHLKDDLLVLLHGLPEIVDLCVLLLQHGLQVSNS